jgi:hypothetical protein
MEHQIPSVPEASRDLNHSPNKGRGTTRSSSYALLVLLFLLSSIQFAFASDSIPETAIMETPFFLEEDTSLLCKNDLAVADANMDGELSSSEFVTFLELYSQGAIVVSKFSEVPLRILMIYFWGACLCSTESGGDSRCCVGDNAHVNLTFKDQREGEVYLFVFCSQVREGIVDVLSGSKSPSQSPSLAPTRFGVLPSNTPSLGPSASPTASISALPSIAPSPSPTLQPTLAVSDVPSFSPPFQEPSAGKFRFHHATSL